jgi:hypothetical protein
VPREERRIVGREIRAESRREPRADLKSPGPTGFERREKMVGTGRFELPIA